MALYYLHLRDGTDELLSPEPVEYRDVQALRDGVTSNARGIMAGQIAEEGTLDFRYRIDAEDEAGNVAYSLRFNHAISVIPGEG